MRRPVVALACAAAALACVAPPALSQDRTPADPVSMARWARDLDTGDPARVADACERFEATGPEAIPVLIEVVRTRTDFAAAVACTLLATRGRDAVAAVPVIEEQIAMRDDRFLRTAARALWKLEARPVKSLPSLRALAKQQELAAAALVWRLTGEEEHLRSILERDAVSENLARRAMVVDVLAEFGPKAGKEFSFRLVLPLARDANAWVRAQSIGVLTAVDPAAPESLVEYELALAAGPQLVRFQAIRGLANRGIDKPGVLAAFVLDAFPRAAARDHDARRPRVDVERRVHAGTAQGQRVAGRQQLRRHRLHRALRLTHAQGWAGPAGQFRGQHEDQVRRRARRRRR